MAAELKLKARAFKACLNGRQALERVLQDLYDAQGVIRRTPTFIVVAVDSATSMSGARPAEQFAKILEGMLEKANAAEATTAAVAAD